MTDKSTDKQQNNNKTQTEALPGNGRGWKPGQSGNPKGRPRLPEGFKEAARAKSLECLEYLSGVVKDEAAMARDRIAAAKLIIEYGYGRPVSFTPEDRDDDKPILVMDK